MSLVVVGLNHKTAPIELLERLAIAEEELPKALHQLLGYEHIVEGTILSTCNRIEVIAVVSRFHGGAQDMRNFLSEFCHVAPEEFTDHLYTYHDEGAARHLFRVAAGIDSLVVGESEILGQVRRAHALASEEGAARRILSHVLRQALTVGKRARAQTAIGRNPVSISSAAVELARRAMPGGSLEGLSVLLVGAGKMGALALRALARAGASDVTIMSRTESSARALAESAEAEPASLDELEDALVGSDIVICSTTSPRAVLAAATVAAAVSRRARPGPLLIVDIAVPRDVDPAVAAIDGVVLRDIYDLRGVVEVGVGSRVGEVSKVEEIVARETERFTQWERVGEMAPAMASLVARADAVRRAELERAAAALADLTDEERAAVDHLTRRLVAKLVHAPLRNARALVDSARGPIYLDAVRELLERGDDTSS
jgi:glutamyl-tRNA reductase